MFKIYIEEIVRGKKKGLLNVTVNGREFKGLTGIFEYQNTLSGEQTMDIHLTLSRRGKVLVGEPVRVFNSKKMSKRETE